MAILTPFSVTAAPHLYCFLPWHVEVVAPVHDKPPCDDPPAQEKPLCDNAPVLDELVHYDVLVLDEQRHDDA